MEKIILVQPNTQSKEPGKFFLKRSLIPQFKIAPLGLLHIAGYLKKKKDYDVELIDANEKRWNENKVAKYILSKNPDFVGLSTNVSTIQKTKDIINILKKQNRDIKTIVGGPLPTTNPIEAINYTNSDFVVSGDGEIPFYNIIINSKNIKKIKKLLGVTIKKKKKIYYNKQFIIKNLDILPMKEWDMINIKKYRPSAASFRKLPAITTVTSRGCPYRCTFCTQGNPQMIYRTVSAKMEKKELVYFKKKKIKDINFFDDNFTLRKDFDEMLKNLKELDFIWNCSTRVDLVNEKMLKKMKEAGCYEIGYGIESSNQKILNQIKKRITIKQIKKAIELTKKNEIEVKAYLMIGYPNEKKKDIEKSINFITKLKPDILSLTILTPLAGTQLWKELNLTGNDLKDEITFWSGNRIASNLYSYQELNKIIRKSNNKYNFSLENIFRTIKKIKSIDDIKRLTIAAASSL